MTQDMYAEALSAMQNADCLYNEEQVLHAIDDMAARITADLADKNPLVIAVMNGGLMPAGLLLPRLRFPLKLDYLHATRYREGTTGHDLVWQHAPNHDLTGRHVLIVDDILDEGHTLAAILDFCQAQHPASLRTAVLAQKSHARGVRPPLEYVGLKVPDRYVFGCGMDFKGYWRNLPGIYALKDN
jgi:hypoxanthine phosphoribosyltransferase